MMKSIKNLFVLLGSITSLYAMEAPRKSPLAITNNSTYNLLLSYSGIHQDRARDFRRVVAPEEEVWLGEAEDIKGIDYNVYGKVYGTVAAAAQAVASYLAPKKGAAIDVTKAYRIRQAELKSGNRILGFSINMSRYLGAIPSFSDTPYLRVIGVGSRIGLSSTEREGVFKGDDQTIMNFLAQSQLFPGLKTRGALLAKVKLNSPQASRYILGLPDDSNNFELDMARDWAKEKVKYLSFESEDLRRLVEAQIDKAYHSVRESSKKDQTVATVPQSTPEQIIKETEEAFTLGESMMLDRPSK